MSHEFRSLIRWAFLGEVGAAGTWKLYATAKRYIGAGSLTLGAGIFKMSLHRASASATILVLSTRDKFSSVGSEITAQGGYNAGGRTLPPATGQWTTGTSTKQMKFTYTTLGLVFTASGAALNNIKYALLHFSVGAATSGKVLCFCTLSSSQFTISSPNTLTILPASPGGVFTLA
jgi:hypothetical protein